MSKPKILVIGDSFLDYYQYCFYRKSNPEAKGSVYNIEKEYYNLGGASAVAVMCASLGASVEIFTQFGDKDYHKFTDIYNSFGIVRSVDISSSQTNIKTRIVIEDSLYPDRFDNEKIEINYNNTLIDKIIKKIDEFNIILISDYGKGMVTQYLLDSLPTNKLIIVDPTIGRSWGDYAKASVIKANRLEAETALKETNSHAILRHLATTLSSIYDRSVIVTAGPIGLYYSYHNQSTHGFINAVKTNAVDICGAGDTIFAALGVYLAEGFSLKEACRYVVQYASQQIQSFGVRPLERITDAIPQIRSETIPTRVTDC